MTERVTVFPTIQREDECCEFLMVHTVKTTPEPCAEQAVSVAALPCVMGQ